MPPRALVSRLSFHPQCQSVVIVVLRTRQKRLAVWLAGLEGMNNNCCQEFAIGTGCSVVFKGVRSIPSVPLIDPFSPGAGMVEQLAEPERGNRAVGQQEECSLLVEGVCWK